MAVKKEKKQTGITWTQLWLIIAIIFGVHQAAQRQHLQDQMSKCICTWDQAINTFSNYIKEN